MGDVCPLAMAREYLFGLGRKASAGPFAECSKEGDVRREHTVLVGVCIGQAPRTDPGDILSGDPGDLHQLEHIGRGVSRPQWNTRSVRTGAHLSKDSYKRILPGFRN